MEWFEELVQPMRLVAINSAASEVQGFIANLQ
jgi:hypothetical protein